MGIVSSIKSGISKVSSVFKPKTTIITTTTTPQQQLAPVRSIDYSTQQTSGGKTTTTYKAVTVRGGGAWTGTAPEVVQAIETGQPLPAERMQVPIKPESQAVTTVRRDVPKEMGQVQFFRDVDVGVGKTLIRAGEFGASIFKTGFGNQITKEDISQRGLFGWRRVDFSKYSSTAKAIKEEPSATGTYVGEALVIVPAISYGVKGFATTARASGIKEAVFETASVFSPLSLKTQLYTADVSKMQFNKVQSFIKTGEGGVSTRVYGASKEGVNIFGFEKITPKGSSVGIQKTTAPFLQVRGGGVFSTFGTKTTVQPFATEVYGGGTGFYRRGILQLNQLRGGVSTVTTSGGIQTYTTANEKTIYNFLNKGISYKSGGVSRIIGEGKIGFVSGKAKPIMEKVFTGKDFATVPSRTAFRVEPPSFLGTEYSIPIRTQAETGTHFYIGGGKKSSTTFFENLYKSTSQLQMQVPRTQQAFQTPTITSTPKLISTPSSKLVSTTKLVSGLIGGTALLSRNSAKLVSSQIESQVPSMKTTYSMVSVTKETSVFASGQVPRFAQTPSQIQSPFQVQTPTLIQSQATAQSTQQQSRMIYTFAETVPFIPPTLFPTKLPIGFGEINRTRKIKGKKQRKKYTPSYESLVLNIRGKQPKGMETGVRIRPIPKGFKWEYGKIKLGRFGF